MATYNKEAVDEAIKSSYKFGQKITKKEAKLIHALLKGHSKPKGKPSPDWVPKGEELMNNIRHSQMMDYRRTGYCNRK